MWWQVRGKKKKNTNEVGGMNREGQAGVEEEAAHRKERSMVVEKPASVWGGVQACEQTVPEPVKVP